MLVSLASIFGFIILITVIYNLCVVRDKLESVLTVSYFRLCLLGLVIVFSWILFN